MIDVIEILISTNGAKATVLEEIYSNNANQYRALIRFEDDSWNNYDKMIVFDRVKNYDTPIGIMVENDNNELIEIIDQNSFYSVIPWEVLTRPGYFTISVYGTLDDNQKSVIVKDNFTIYDGGNTTVYPRIPTPNMYEQLLKKIKEVSNKIDADIISDAGRVTSDNGEIFNDYETNQALGLWSHVEGGRCNNPEGEECHNIAKGVRAHIEGSGNLVVEGVYDAHVEGSLNIGAHNQVHVEGYKNTASEHQAHAEGNTTTASGKQSHSEGWNTEASGNYAHTEGTGTLGSGVATHAEGQGTKATGAQAHSEGYMTEAIGQASHTEGRNTKANSYGGHAGGIHTEAIGSAGFAHGIHVVSKGKGQFVIGEANEDDEKALFIIGNGISDMWSNNIIKKSNAFTVNKDGTATIQNSGVNDNNVVNYKQLKDYVLNNSKASPWDVQSEMLFSTGDVRITNEIAENGVSKGVIEVGVDSAYLSGHDYTTIRGGAVEVGYLSSRITSILSHNGLMVCDYHGYFMPSIYLKREVMSSNQDDIDLELTLESLSFKKTNSDGQIEKTTSWEDIISAAEFVKNLIDVSVKGM